MLPLDTTQHNTIQYIQYTYTYLIIVTSSRPLFPQWSHHVYPQFLPGSHPNASHGSPEAAGGQVKAHHPHHHVHRTTCSNTSQHHHYKVQSHHSNYANNNSQYHSRTGNYHRGHPLQSGKTLPLPMLCHSSIIHILYNTYIMLYYILCISIFVLFSVFMDTYQCYAIYHYFIPHYCWCIFQETHSYNHI